MAKRYYQGNKDRKNEAKGMKKYMSEGKYSNYDVRRRQEYEDSMMIREDPNEIANLPQAVKYVQYAKEPYYNSPRLDDTIRGVDYNIYQDVTAPTLKREKYPEKY